jgi:hypothetical protein
VHLLAGYRSVVLAADSASESLQPPTGQPGHQGREIYGRGFGRAADWQDHSREDLSAELLRTWEAFVAEDLPEIVAALSGPIEELERRITS